MPSSVEVKRAAVDELLGDLIPMLNQISSSAFFIRSGSWEHSKHRLVEDKLTRWIAQNSEILPDEVIVSVSRLNSRLIDWSSNWASTATPHNFATDKTDSFCHVERTLSQYKQALLTEGDKSDLDVKLAVVRASRGPWATGSFYLTAVVLLLAVLAIIAGELPLVALPIVFAAAGSLLLIVGALQLRHDERLSPEYFIELVKQIALLYPLRRRSNLDRHTSDAEPLSDA